MSDNLNPQENEDDEFVNVEYENEDQELQEEEQAIQQTANPLPEKYKGKSVTDIVKMHQEAEKALGRQGAEVGELRRVVDEFIKRQFASSGGQGSPGVTATEEPDFFREPERAVQSIVQNDPRLRDLQEQTEILRRQASLNRLEKAHPDYLELVEDDEFQEWVGKSKVRTALMARADASFDFDSADELFSTFKELKGRKTSPNTTEGGSVPNAPQSARKAVGQTLPHGRTTPSDTGMGNKGKLWKRRTIIELMKDPVKYAEHAAEIRNAYEEGRVR